MLWLFAFPQIEDIESEKETVVVLQQDTHFSHKV
jgi:hypothetical protein